MVLARISAAPLLLLLSGCAAVVPHTLNTPLLTQRHTGEAGLNVGLHGADLQVAYAATDRLILVGSGQQGLRYNRSDRAASAEAGAGYALLRPGPHRLAIYGGLGYGAGRTSRDRVRHGYAYLQPTYVVQPHRIFALSLAVKGTGMHLFQWQRRTDPPEWLTNAPIINRDGAQHTLLQPGCGLHLQVGPGWWLSLRQSLAIPLQREFSVAVPFVCGIGLQYRFGGRSVPAEEP